MPPFTTGNPLIDSPTQKLIANVRGRFQDTQKQLQQRQANITSQAGRQREIIGSQFKKTETGARGREIQQRGQEQQNIQDQIRQQRIRARSTGGALSSGFLELTGRAEREGARRLAGITGATEQTISGARGVEQSGLAELEQGLSDAIFEIENNRAASRREKDAAIAQIEQQAAQQALALQEAARNRAAAGRGGGGGGIGDFLSQLGIDPSQVTPEQAAQLQVLFTDPLEQKAQQIAGQRGDINELQGANLRQGGVFSNLAQRRIGQQQLQNAFRSTGLLGAFGGRKLTGGVQGDVIQNINQLLRR